MSTERVKCLYLHKRKLGVLKVKAHYATIKFYQELFLMSIVLSPKTKLKNRLKSITQWHWPLKKAIVH